MISKWGFIWWSFEFEEVGSWEGSNEKCFGRDAWNYCSVIIKIGILKGILVKLVWIILGFVGWIIESEADELVKKYMK